MFCFLNWSLFLSRKLSKFLQDIEKGHHDDQECEKYCKQYKKIIGQELPDCEYKGNKSKIQNLIRKIHIDANGSVTEIQFNNKKNDEEINAVKGKTMPKMKKWMYQKEKSMPKVKKWMYQKEKPMPKVKNQRVCEQNWKTFFEENEV